MMMVKILVIILAIVVLPGCCRKKTVKKPELVTETVPVRIESSSPRETPVIPETGYGEQEKDSRFNFDSFSNIPFMKAYELMEDGSYTNAQYLVKNAMSKYSRNKGMQMQGNYFLAEIARRQNNQQEYQRYMDKFMESMYELGNSREVVDVSKTLQGNQQFLEGLFQKKNLKDIGVNSLDELNQESE